MTELQPHDLIIGYWYHSVKFNKPVQLTATDIYDLVANADGARIDSYISAMFEPLELTEDWMRRFDFKKIPHFTIMNSYVLDLGRNRFLSIGCIGEPNEMMWLTEVDEEDNNKINDLICIHNYDYDGYLYVHKLQDIHQSLTGTVLKAKQI